MIQCINNNNININNTFNPGKINYDILAGLLTELGIGIYARNVGGRTNCSMELILATGEVRLKFSGRRAFKSLCKPWKIT